MRAQNTIFVAFVAVAAAGCWTMDSKSTRTNSTPEIYSPNITATPKSSLTPSATPASNTKTTDPGSDKPFFKNVPPDFAQPSDDSGRLLLREYGSLFVARGGALAPKKVVFKDEADVSTYQSTLQRSTDTIGGFKVELQTPALNALKAAIADAKAAKLTITPRAADSARRGYAETVTLWASRVEPGLTHWVGLGKLTQAEATRIKALSPFEQVPEILKLENQGMFFAKDLSKSIIYSVAPPGTSQHLSMLALDVKENDNSKVRDILAKHGWFQTVSSDLPHFTFLGAQETELPGLGLKKKTDAGRTFWVPDI